LYSIPRFGFKYAALGEVVVFLVFGVGIAEGAYFVQAGELSLSCALYAIPFGIFVALILFANNMRDVCDDSELGVKTSCVRIGSRASRYAFMAMLMLSYAIIAALVLAGAFAPPSLVAFVTFPIAARLMMKVRRMNAASGEAMVGMDAAVAQLSLLFGASFVAGIIFS
jgi:1,4-dihydroxy-2-naphthoate octaprenyltransferase